MIELRQATQEDLDYVKANPIEKAAKDYVDLPLSGYARTAVVDGDVIGVGGVVVYWKGFGEAWVILSEKANDHKVEMVLCIEKFIEEAIAELDLQRLQCTARTDFPKGIELIEHLGFKREGLMRCYNPDGSDAYMYARII